MQHVCFYWGGSEFCYFLPLATIISESVLLKNQGGPAPFMTNMNHTCKTEKTDKSDEFFIPNI